MPDEIEKSDQPSHDDVLAAITSFNDPTIITNMFRELGWTYSFEIKEWLMIAKQNANLSVKSKALIQLRKLLQEAAEAAGYTASVSQTMPNIQGGHTTFQAKRITNILNPTKQIETTVKETQDDKKETRTEPDRRGDRGQSQTENGGTQNGVHRRNISSEPIQDTGCAFPTGDVESGGTEPPDGGETPGPVPGGDNDGNANNNCIGKDGECTSGGNAPTENPCIQTRPPTCNQDLFPGISSAEES